MPDYSSYKRRGFITASNCLLPKPTSMHLRVHPASCKSHQVMLHARGCGPINRYPRLRQTRRAVASHQCLTLVVSLSLQHNSRSLLGHIRRFRVVHKLVSTTRLSRTIPSRQQASGCPRHCRERGPARAWQRPAQICTPSRRCESL